MALGEMGCSSEDLRLFHGKAEEVQFARGTTMRNDRTRYSHN
jgi:hypothetical protein